MMEYASLSEAVRMAQQVNAETQGNFLDDDGPLDPVLSRIQRKLGEEPSA
jgi:hypothetical protein